METVGYHYSSRHRGPAGKNNTMVEMEMEKLSASTEQLIAARQALCDALRKTKELGIALDRSESKLRSIGGRLPPLEKAMAPLLVQTSTARCLATQIEEAVSPAKLVLKKFEELRALEVTVMREPKENLEGYLVAVQKLNECLGYIKQNSKAAIQLLEEAADTVMQPENIGTDKARARRITDALAALKSHRAGDANANLDGGVLDIALERLAKEFKRIMVEHTLPLTLPERMDVPSADACVKKSDPTPEQILLPPAVLKRLYTIMSAMATNFALEKCVDAYREIRSTRAFVSLQGLKLDYLKSSSSEALDKLDWDNLQTMIGSWSEHIEVAVKVLYAGERQLCEQVLGRVGDGKYVDECLYKVAKIGMLQFLSFGEGVARGHRAPEKLFKLLDMFDALDKCMGVARNVFVGERCQELYTQVRELQDMVVTQACQTFWEFKQWVSDQHEGTMAPDGSVTRLNSYVVNYLKYLVSDYYSPIMDKVLKAEQGRGQGRSDERGLAQGVLLFMQALERQVEGRSNEYSDNGLRHIVLMNNIWYMRTRAKKCELGPLLGEAWLSEQRRKVEQHALAYEHEVWGGVLKTLTRDGLNVQGRSAVRELVVKRLREFNASFESACQRHLKWVITEEDLKQGTRVAVVQAVVPSYRSFTNTFAQLFDNGSGPKNYLKYTPETVEQMISDLLNGRLEMPRNGCSAQGRSSGGAVQGRPAHNAQGGSSGGAVQGRQAHVPYAASQPPYRDRAH